MRSRVLGAVALLIVLLVSSAFGGRAHTGTGNQRSVDANICEAIAAPTEIGALMGIERAFFGRFNAVEDTAGGTCRWGVHDEWAGPSCQSVSPERRALGDCVERVVEVSFDCRPEQTRNASAVEHVRASAMLGGDELDIGDAGLLRRQRVLFAQSGCVVTVQRLRSMDLDAGVTGAELDQALVSLAAKTAAAMRIVDVRR